MGREAFELVNRFAGVAVLCVGDAMLDRYVYGEATRISPEAPVPVVHVRRQALMPGGVGNVSRNLVDLGVIPHTLSVIGDDGNASVLSQHLSGPGHPPPVLLRDPRRPTIVKTRIIAGIQQVVRFDEELTAPLSPESADGLLAAAERIMPSVRAVAVSDYGKGVVAGGVVGRIIDLAHRHGLPVVVDPKGHEYGRYRNVDLIKPNRKELGEAVGRTVADERDATAAARELMERHRVKNVLVTLSDKGMLLLRERDGGREPVMLPSRAREVFDVTGAGDTVLAVMAAAMAAAAPLELGARLATLAAGVVVGKVGTATVKPEEILRSLED